LGLSVGNSKRSGRTRRNKLNAEINVTPLVDVMLVLLIVFMIAAPLLSVGVPVELPKTDAKSLLLQDTEVDLDDMASRLGAISANGYDERIYLRADEASDYGAVMKVMARVNQAGFSNLGLVTDPIQQ